MALIGSKTGMNRWHSGLDVARLRPSSIRAKHSTNLLNLPAHLQDMVRSYIPVRRSGRVTTKTRRRKRGRRRGIIRRRIPPTLTTRTKVIRAKITDGFTSAGEAAGAIAIRLHSVMNVCDPTSGYGNKQFLGYDQWKTLYNKAVVLGVKVLVRCHNKGTVGMIFGVVAMPENKSNTNLTSYEHYAEVPSSKQRLLSPDVDHGVLVYKVNTRKHLDLKSLRDEDAFHNNLNTETAASRTFWLNHFFQPLDKTTQCAFEAVIEYEYLIRLFDPIFPDRSTAA